MKALQTLILNNKISLIKKPPDKGGFFYDCHQPRFVSHEPGKYKKNGS